MINKHQIIGRVGKNPEVRQLENGSKVAAFSMATTETWKDGSGQKVEHTEWHNVVLWKGLAEVAEKYIKKGDLLLVEGPNRTRSWEAEDGTKRYVTELIGKEIKMLGSSRNNQATANDDVPPPSENDDLPF